MVIRRTPIALILIMILGSIAAAQTGGQFCLRAFEDRNGNGVFESGEPFLTRGVSANLLNGEGVIVASALMDDSPNAAQGVICFQFLTEGQYSMVISSPEYTATSSDTVSAAISAGTLPTVVEYGAQRLVVEPVPTSAPSLEQILQDQRDLFQRLVLSGLGSLLAVAGMIVVGVFVYLLAFRGRRGSQSQVTPAAMQTPTPGSLSAVKISDTGELKKN